MIILKKVPSNLLLEKENPSALEKKEYIELALIQYPFAKYVTEIARDTKKNGIFVLAEYCREPETGWLNSWNVLLIWLEMEQMAANKKEVNTRK